MNTMVESGFTHEPWLEWSTEDGDETIRDARHRSSQKPLMAEIIRQAQRGVKSPPEKGWQKSQELDNRNWSFSADLGSSKIQWNWSWIVLGQQPGAQGYSHTSTSWLLMISSTVYMLVISYVKLGFQHMSLLLSFLCRSQYQPQNSLSLAMDIHQAMRFLWLLYTVDTAIFGIQNRTAKIVHGDVHVNDA